MALSEFDIINRFFSSPELSAGQSVVLGPGDDCAIIAPPEGQELCISTDTLICGVHFPEYCPAEVVAHRSLVANLSDLAAMGALPLGFTLALTLPRVDESWLEKFSSRLTELVQKYQSPLIGGNLSKGQLSLTLQVLGSTPKGKALRRSGANPGDDLYVSGTLGGAAYGMKAVTEKLQATEALLHAYYYPRPRLDLGVKLRNLASSAIDISDGLLADVGHIAEQSKRGVIINASSIPLSDELVNQIGEPCALGLALSGGDDYELCFTAPKSARQKINKLGKVFIIGEITPGSGVLCMDDEGKPMDISLEGYDHFHE